jgi:hypothetical protein
MDIADVVVAAYLIGFLVWGFVCGKQPFRKFLPVTLFTALVCAAAAACGYFHVNGNTLESTVLATSVPWGVGYPVGWIWRRISKAS